jgi:RimJ/RimL family protein N-acetyltransferase
MMKNKIFVNQNITLRDTLNRDKYDYINVPFNKELLKMYGSDMSPNAKKSIEKAEQLLEEIKSNPYEWVIDYKGVFIGQVRLTVEEKNNKAKFAIGIFNPNYWNKGIGTLVSKEVLNFAFKELKLHRVYLKVLKYNKRAIKSYTKLGFKIEGEERDSIYLNGKYETDIHMGILSDEFGC